MEDQREPFTLRTRFPNRSDGLVLFIYLRLADGKGVRLTSGLKIHLPRVMVVWKRRGASEHLGESILEAGGPGG